MKEKLISLYLSSLSETVSAPEIDHALIESGYVEITEGGAVLTELGRSQFKVVFTGGTYDLLHSGHLFTLQEAKGFGDVLVVIIARDSTVSARKRVPFQNEKERLKLMQNIRVVDLALLGDEHDHLKTVEIVAPDIIALGADQMYDDDVLLRKIHQRGLKDVEIRRLESDYEGLSTTKLIRKIVSRYCDVEEI